MDSLFREFEIYASTGPEVRAGRPRPPAVSYAEATDGQILEEGITEAGSMASFIAAGTAYATHGVPMIPFYTFYSMFGFQRVGDLIWQAADIRARGFLMGATAGRTTLVGEGLQHQDGHSLVLASTVPVVRPTTRRSPTSWGRSSSRVSSACTVPTRPRTAAQLDPDVIYYITLYNENYVMPKLAPEQTDDFEAGAVRGLYRWAAAPEGPSKRATILFSGISHGAASEAVTELAEHYDVGAELWSATSYKKLREEALAVERRNRLHPSAADARPTRHTTPGPSHRGRSRPSATS